MINSNGVNLTVQDPFSQDARIQDLYFNISHMKLAITSLYIISDALKCDIIWTENSDVIDSFISEILKYESSVIESLTEKPQAVLFTPFKLIAKSLDINSFFPFLLFRQVHDDAI